MIIFASFIEHDTFVFDMKKDGNFRKNPIIPHYYTKKIIHKRLSERKYIIWSRNNSIYYLNYYADTNYIYCMDLNKMNNSFK